MVQASGRVPPPATQGWRLRREGTPRTEVTAIVACPNAEEPTMITRVDAIEARRLIDAGITVLDALPLNPAWRHYLIDLADHKLLEVARTQGTRVLEAPSGVSLDPPVPPDAPILRQLPGSY